ncbi:MAG TPA: arginine--tRNA ligase [Patescibacteria group bacterium]
MMQQLRDALKTATRTAYPHIALPTYEVSRPDTSAHGDFSTNLALIFARMVKENPYDVAEKIVAHLPKLEMVEKVETVRPGFINFYMKPACFLDKLTELVEQGITITPQSTEPERILLEFGQPNTHKLPHIGHLFSYIYGASCANLLEATGVNVLRLNYQGDVGPHVAKCLWAYRKKQQADPELLEDKISYLQQCYQEGAQAYEEDTTAKAEINALNTEIYEHDPDVMSDWKKTREWSVAYYRDHLHKVLGISYDTLYYESETGPLGKSLVKEKVGLVFEEDQGAVVFRGEQFGLHTRVFLSSAGNPTYEAKEIGLFACKKRDYYPFDRAVITTAVEQNEYWQVVKKAAEMVFPDLEGKIKHIGYGMINLTSGKMSSRTGNILSAFGLIDLVRDTVKEKVAARDTYTQEEISTITHEVTLGAIRYSFLKTSPGKNIAFDLDTSIAFEGNSGPYLQYTYARCQSVLRKAEVEASVSDAIDPNDEELAVLRWLSRYDEVVHAAAESYAPHLVANYLFELAQKYSYFYNQHHILTEDQGQTQFRLAITKVVGETLKHGLHLLGIETLEKI